MQDLDFVQRIWMAKPVGTSQAEKYSLEIGATFGAAAVSVNTARLIGEQWDGLTGPQQVATATIGIAAMSLIVAAGTLWWQMQIERRRERRQAHSVRIGLTHQYAENIARITNAACAFEDCFGRTTEAGTTTCVGKGQLEPVTRDAFIAIIPLLAAMEPEEVERARVVDSMTTSLRRYATMAETFQESMFWEGGMKVFHVALNQIAQSALAMGMTSEIAHHLRQASAVAQFLPGDSPATEAAIENALRLLGEDEQANNA